MLQLFSQHRRMFLSFGLSLMLCTPLALTASAQDASYNPPKRAQFVSADGVATVLLYDNATTQDLLKALPVTLTLEDVFAAEKWGRLPHALMVEGNDMRIAFEPGEVGYYMPTHSLVVFPRGFIPSDRFVKVGMIERGIETLAVKGPRRIQIDARP